MTNPFDPTYLTTASPTFGPFAGSFLGLQIASSATGLYLAFARRDNNQFRHKLVVQLGLALIVGGGCGLLLSGLRLANLPVFNQRYWFYLLLLLEAALAGYALFYARTIYPRQLAQSQTVRGKIASRQQKSTQVTPATQSPNGQSTLPIAPETTVTRSRREARRANKRKNR